MNTITVPCFLALRAGCDGREHLDRRLVAAIRYDYEVGLASMVDVCRKYGAHLSAQSARDIMNGKTYPGVKAALYRDAHLKKWRRK